MAIVGSNVSEIGYVQGSNTHTLGLKEMPKHTHDFRVSWDAPSSSDFVGNFFTSPIGFNIFTSSSTNNFSISTESIGIVGSNEPHENRQPSLVLYPYIAVTEGARC